MIRAPVGAVSFYGAAGLLLRADGIALFSEIARQNFFVAHVIQG